MGILAEFKEQLSIRGHWFLSLLLRAWEGTLQLYNQHLYNQSGCVETLCNNPETWKHGEPVSFCLFAGCDSSEDVQVPTLDPSLGVTISLLQPQKQ